MFSTQTLKFQWYCPVSELGSPVTIFFLSQFFVDFHYFFYVFWEKNCDVLAQFWDWIRDYLGKNTYGYMACKSKTLFLFVERCYISHQIAFLSYLFSMINEFLIISKVMETSLRDFIMCPLHEVLSTRMNKNAGAYTSLNFL